jgi:hypothetical protein
MCLHTGVQQQSNTNTLEPTGHSKTTSPLSPFTQQQPSATSVAMHMLSQKEKFDVFKNVTIIISSTF